MMQTVAQRRATATACGQVLLTLITAPLLTISTSLQASIPQNRMTLHTLIERQPNLNFLRTEPSRFQQMNYKDRQQALERDRKGAMWRPFKPASYAATSEAVRGIYKQGPPLAFYKGNGVRSLHILLFHKLNTDFTYRAETLFGQSWQQLKQTPLMAELVLSCSVDFLL